eukprot:511380-Rhodomonas_salina.1
MTVKSLGRYHPPSCPTLFPMWCLITDILFSNAFPMRCRSTGILWSYVFPMQYPSTELLLFYTFPMRCPSAETWVQVCGIQAGYGARQTASSSHPSRIALPYGPMHSLAMSDTD